MEIVQIVGLGIVAAVLAVMLKTQRPEIAVLVSIIAGIVIFMMFVNKIAAVIELMNEYSQKIEIDQTYIGTLMKITGIAYVAEFGSEVCRDAGELSIASKIEFAGKVIIATLAIPIIMSLLELIIRIMP